MTASSSFQDVEERSPSISLGRQQSTLLKFIYFVLGVGVLCPFNAFINARPYFSSRFCVETSSFAGDNIEVVFTVLFNFASVLSLMVLLAMQYFWQDGIDLRSLCTCHPLSASLRASLGRLSDRDATDNPDYSSMMVLIPLSVYLAVFLFTTMLVFWPDAPVLLVFCSTLIGLFLCGVCMSVASSGIIGSASLFRAEGPYFQGQAFGGVVVALINGGSAWSEDPADYQQNVCQATTSSQDDAMSADDVCVPYNTSSISTGFYFFLNCLILAICIIGFMYVADKKKKRELKLKNYTPVLDVSESWMRKIEAEDTASVSISRPSSPSVEVEGVSEEDEEESERAIHVVEPASTEKEQSASNPSFHEQSTRFVWDAVKLPAVALFLTYTVTLTIFPVITSDLTSIGECRSESRLRNDMFVPLTFFTFNLGDLVGRILVSDETAEKNRLHWPRKLVWASLARFFFIPMFFLCFSKRSLYKDVAIPSDLFSWVMQFSMALTNGVLTTVSFSVAAALLPMEENLQQIASSILNLSLCLGLVVGGLLASPMLFLYTGNW